MTYPIPSAALDDRLAFIGTAGSGKTYNAGSAVEKLLASGARVVIVDPLDVWWGLRLTPDGKPSRFTLPIFGGEHGDLPLNEQAGKLVGETVAGMAESCIVSLGGMATKAAEQRFMLAFLEAIYRHASGNPVHVIFDEADLWAPQNAGKEGGNGPKLQGLMEQLVRRGRVRGFVPWLITQRPAVLSKDVLSQADGLVAFKLTASQDRDALGAWIEGQADKAQGKEILASLPTMQRGQGVVWIPGRNVLVTAQFPEKATFDSSRTPTRGEKRQQHALKPLDLAGLKDRLASIEEEAKANDPHALKAEVSRLKRDLAKAERAVAAPPPVATFLAPTEDELRNMPSAFLDDLRTKAFAEGMRRVAKAMGDAITKLKIPELNLGDHFAGVGNMVPPRTNLQKAQSAPRPAPVPITADGSVPAGCAKPLAALAAVFPSGLTEAQWATAAGYKRSGGTWGTYKSRLRGAGLIEAREGRFFATEAGAGAVGDVELPPSPGPDLVRWWAAKLPGTSRVAEALIDAWPTRLSKDDLAARVEMSAAGGSFGTYLSRLVGPGLITRDGGMIGLSPDVMAQP